MGRYCRPACSSQTKRDDSKPAQSCHDGHAMSAGAGQLHAHAAHVPATSAPALKCVPGGGTLVQVEGARFFESLGSCHLLSIGLGQVLLPLNIAIACAACIQVM